MVHEFLYKPLQNPDHILYIDGSSFMSKGKIYAGHAIVLNYETWKQRPFLRDGLSKEQNCGHQ